jgi:hypothetical protein
MVPIYMILQFSLLIQSSLCEFRAGLNNLSFGYKNMRYFTFFFSHVHICSLYKQHFIVKNEVSAVITLISYKMYLLLSLVLVHSYPHLCTNRIVREEKLTRGSNSVYLNKDSQQVLKCCTCAQN